MKIISVDDSETIFNHIKLMLESLENVIHSAHAYNLNDAKQLINEHQPEVIILDIILKEESGIELLEFIKLHHPEIDVIILSNHSELFYKNKCKELGAKFFLDKSYEFDKLPQLLSKLNQS